MLSRLAKAGIHWHYSSFWVVQAISILLIIFLTSTSTYAAELEPRSITIANDYPAASTTYTLNVAMPFSETLGSMFIQFCSNSPLISDVCDAPTGLDVSAASIVSQAGPADFSILSQTANSLTLTRPAIIVSAENISLEFSGVINPSSLGSFYGRIQTFQSTDASGVPTDIGGIAMATASSVTVSTYVPPYLLFCTGVTIPNLNCDKASGDYINFGNLSSLSTSSSASQMLVATNALSGYGIQVNGSSMTSGNNVISPLGISDLSAPGVSQFGLNLVANSRPQIGNNAQGPGSGQALTSYDSPNIFRFSNGDTLASSNAASAEKEYTISYIINIGNSQPPGYYATTLTYIAMGNF